MIFFITTKKLNEKRLKMLNKILECHMRGAHALPHEVSAFIHTYIYIYIYKIGSSYIWCNFTKVTHFLDRRFLKDLMVKKKIIKYDCFHLII